MANNKVRTRVVSANHSMEETTLTAASAKVNVVFQLRSELESERRRVRELRRERANELQMARDQEQDRAAAAMREMTAKFQQTLEQKTRLLRCRQKTEIENVVKQKDREMKRLRRDFVRCQDDLKEETYRRGLSTSARVAFDLERSKMLQEIKELGTSKKHLEDALCSATEAVKRKSLEIRQLQETTKNEIAKVNQEASAEITQILRELKTKDRLTFLTKREGSCTKKLLPKFQQTTENKSVHFTSDSNFTAETESLRRNLSTVEESLQTIKCGGNLSNFSMQRRLYDLERQLTYLASVSRQFTEKNNHLRRTNKEQEQRIVSLTEQNKTLNTEVKSSKGEIKRLNDLMNTSGVSDLMSTIEDLCSQIKDYEAIANSDKNKLQKKTVKFLLANDDKAVSPMKELMYDDGGGGGGEEGGGGGNEEEDRSAKQSYAAGIANGDDRMAQDWQIQRESLTIVIQTLEDKLKNYEENEEKLQMKLLEASDRNEELEFRILELENCADEKESFWLKEKESLKSELSNLENKLKTIKNDSNNIMERNVATQCDQEMLTSKCEEDKSFFHHDLTDDHKLSVRTKLEWSGDIQPTRSANEIDNIAPPKEDIRPTRASSANLSLDIKERRDDGRWDASEDRGGDGDDADDRGPMLHGISESLVDSLKRKLMRSQIREQQMKDQMLLLAEEKNRHLMLLQQQIECLESNGQDPNSVSSQKFTQSKHGAGGMERPSPEGLEDGDNSREFSGIDDGKGGGRTVRLKLETTLHWVPVSNDVFSLTPLSGDCRNISRKLEHQEFREEQLCQQISDLERDRDILHEVIHNNERALYELQADIDRLRQSEKDLHRIVSRLETAEEQLRTKADNMAAYNADMEQRLKQLKDSESVLLSNLKQSRSAELDWKMKVEELTEAKYACEAAWKRRLLELDAQNRRLNEKIKELDEQVGELESTECALKQKLKRKEKSESCLWAEFEVIKRDLNVASNHVSDLEYEKEQLTQKLEKALMDLTVETIRNKQDKEAMNVKMVEINCKVKVLEESICGKEATISTLESKLREHESREIKTRKDHRIQDADQQFALHNDGRSFPVKLHDPQKGFRGFCFDECDDDDRLLGGGGDGGGNTSSCSIYSVLSYFHENPSIEVESADEASEIVDEDDGADFERANGAVHQHQYECSLSSSNVNRRLTDSPMLDSNCDSGVESLRQEYGDGSCQENSVDREASLMVSKPSVYNGCRAQTSTTPSIPVCVRHPSNSQDYQKLHGEDL